MNKSVNSKRQSTYGWTRPASKAGANISSQKTAILRRFARPYYR